MFLAGNLMKISIVLSIKKKASTVWRKIIIGHIELSVLNGVGIISLK